MEGHFAGKSVLVTGAAGAIGSAIASTFHQAGASVILVDVLPDVAPALSSLIGQRGFYRVCDISSPKDVEQTFFEIRHKYGRLDVLANAAGVVSRGATLKIAPSEWSRVLDINLNGTFFCCQQALALMLPQRYGRIVNIGSVIGQNGGNARPWIDPSEQEFSSNVAYSASKGAVHSITRFLAREFASAGITVNAVVPGPIASDMTQNYPPSLIQLIPASRMGSPDDVAKAVAFLATEEASYINGALLNVNGAIFVG